MARFMRPIFIPLDDPTAPDPADLTDLQNFAAINLPDVEDPLDAAAKTLVDTSSAIDAEALVMDAMGTDLGGAFELLNSYAVEEDADTFAEELAAASAGDQAIAAMLSNLTLGTDMTTQPGGPKQTANLVPLFRIIDPPPPPPPPAKPPDNPTPLPDP